MTVANRSVYPVRTAARLLGLSRQRIYQLITSGDLTAIRLDGTVLITASSIAARQRSHGRPK